MVQRRQPGEFEQVVLLSLAGLKEEAGGGEVYDALLETTGREVSLAAIHIALSRMEGKGWVSVSTQPPPAGKGGKPRRFYSLTPSGAAILRDLRSQYDRLWEGARAHPGLGGE
ncbi:PadR family transcriptional regulator [Gemmatimonadota bacterium]